MKNKILSIFIIMLLFTTFVPIMCANSEDMRTNNTTNSNSNGSGYILDQMQTTSSYYDVISASNSLAQDFKPSITPLAKVRLLIRAEDQIIEPLKVSIRDDLSGEDLTSISVPASRIPTTGNWINFDFPDISVNIDKTYFIVAQTTNKDLKYHWFLSYNQDIDFYENGSGWFNNVSIGENWLNWDEYHQPYNDFCFKTYSIGGKQSDLDCKGIFGWPDQKPGSIINDSFIIENIGDSNSLLNWEIEEFPSWGNWTFTPDEGYDLTPEDGEITVLVSVEVPNEKNKYYTDNIKIVNRDNSSDYSIISVSLSTSANKEKIPYDIISTIIQKIIQHFPFFRFLLTMII